MKVYISGPITGVENYRQLFKIAEVKLHYAGYEVVNPCELPHQHGQTYEEFLKEDVFQLLQCTHIHMLDGWQDSNGAKLEAAVAVNCGIEAVFLVD